MIISFISLSRSETRRKRVQYDTSAQIMAHSSVMFYGRFDNFQSWYQQSSFRKFHVKINKYASHFFRSLSVDHDYKTSKNVNNEVTGNHKRVIFPRVQGRTILTIQWQYIDESLFSVYLYTSFLNFLCWKKKMCTDPLHCRLRKRDQFVKQSSLLCRLSYTHPCLILFISIQSV